MKIGDWARHIVTNARGEVTELGEDLVTIKFVAANTDKRMPRIDQAATHRYRRRDVEWIANPDAGELIVVVLPSTRDQSLVAVFNQEEFSMPWPHDAEPPAIIITPEGDHLLAVNGGGAPATGRAIYTRAFIIADMRNMRAAIGGAT